MDSEDERSGPSGTKPPGPPPESVRVVKERLKWGTDRATKALQMSHSSFLTHRYRNEEHACISCGEPIGGVEPGQTTHPNSEEISRELA